ncbi:hypothetical protein TNCV_2082621 [Trichonephila clavipes]|nr:hypothetical protein TNCV_2082621 [Trichonephila clavipes]
MVWTAGRNGEYLGPTANSGFGPQAQICTLRQSSIGPPRVPGPRQCGGVLSVLDSYSVILVGDFFENENIQHMQWPTNLIQHAWDMLGRRIAALHINQTPFQN